jgi:hypothetical protein
MKSDDNWQLESKMFMCKQIAPVIFDAVITKNSFRTLAVVDVFPLFELTASSESAKKFESGAAFLSQD